MRYTKYQGHNNANTTPSGKDSAPPLRDTLPSQKKTKKEKKRMTKEVCTETDGMSKKTKTNKTNMNKKTTVARIPVLELLVVVLVVNIIPVIVLSDPLVRQVPSLAHTEPQSWWSHICWSQIMTQMRNQIMWIYPSPLGAKSQIPEVYLYD